MQQKGVANKQAIELVDDVAGRNINTIGSRLPCLSAMRWQAGITMYQHWNGSI